MSATYRIEIRRDPHSTMCPWDACVFRLSDDERVTICIGRTRDHALAEARQWVTEEEGYDDPRPTPAVVYVDDQGRDAEAPQSVKV